MRLASWDNWRWKHKTTILRGGANPSLSPWCRFSCRFRLIAPLISGVNPVPAHLYLPVCILRLTAASLLIQQLSSPSISMLHSQPRETDWLQTGCDRQSLPPSSGGGWCFCLISWFSCVNRRCCMRFSGGACTFFFIAFMTRVVIHCLTFIACYVYAET